MEISRKLYVVLTDEADEEVAREMNYTVISLYDRHNHRVVDLEGDPSASRLLSIAKTITKYAEDVRREKNTKKNP